MSSIESGTHGRTFLVGKLTFNFGGSSIDCIVRRLSDEGDTVEQLIRLTDDTGRECAWDSRTFPAVDPKRGPTKAVQARVAVRSAAGIEV